MSIEHEISPTINQISYKGMEGLLFSYENHRPFVINVLLNRGNDLQTAEDLVQEATEKLLTMIGKKPDKYNFETPALLLSAAIRLKVDQYRKSKNRQNISFDDALDSIIPVTTDRPTEDASLLKSIVEEVIKDFPKELKIPLLYYIFNSNLRYEDIAIMTGMTKGELIGKIVRARKEYLENLKEKHADEIEETLV